MTAKYCIRYILLLSIFFTSLYSNYHFTFLSHTPDPKFFATKSCTATKSYKEPLVTIWVHGTRFFSRPFFKKFFDVPAGLNKATILSKEYQHCCIAQTLCKVDPYHFQLEHFYLFGWSGLLSIKARQKAAKQLAHALEVVCHTYQKKNLNPHICIITHSHGGNVVLHLAELQTSVHIDELILLACPVQEQTKQYIQHPMFKNIISLYSAWDSIQTLDPQGLYHQKQWLQFASPLFSERTFSLQPNLAQVELWFNNRGPLHIEFLLCNSLSSIVRLLPKILTIIKDHFSTFETVNPKPIEKLMITSEKFLEWKEKTKAVLKTTSETVKSYLAHYKLIL